MSARIILFKVNFAITVGTIFRKIFGIPAPQPRGPLVDIDMDSAFREMVGLPDS